MSVSSFFLKIGESVEDILWGINDTLQDAAAAWDRQFEADARNGRLESLVNEASAEYKTGKTSSL